MLCVSKSLVNTKDEESAENPPVSLKASPGGETVRMSDSDGVPSGLTLKSATLIAQDPANRFGFRNFGDLVRSVHSSSRPSGENSAMMVPWSLSVGTSVSCQACEPSARATHRSE